MNPIYSSKLWIITGILAGCSMKGFSQDVEGKWSGTMTQVEKGDMITGSFEKTITLMIADNVVTGSVQGWEKTKKPLIVGTSICNGSGKGELWRVSFNDDGTYDLEVISPDFTCTSDGVTSDIAHITVSASSKIGTNRNLLTGTYTNTSNDAMGIASKTVTWHLTRSTTKSELIVTPENYDTWMPEPGPNEFTKGSTIKIFLKLHGINGQPPVVKAKTFELRLSSTSNEPGMTLNAPLNPQDTHPDLRFIIGTSTGIGSDFQSATVNCRDGINGEITIAAFDGGGYTTLTVEAILEDKSRIEGHLLISGGKTEIPIPKRPNGSNIAEAWLTANGNPNDMDDTELSVGNSNIGDGLTAYEEYRGVTAEGKYRRLDPREKELGVWLKKTDLPLFLDGLSWFENASGIKVIRFIDNEINTDRQLNKHFETSHGYDQFVLKLEKKHVRKGVLGRTEPGPGIPKTVSRIKIDYDQIAAQQRQTELDAIRFNVQLPYTLEEMVAKTVAHELSHGVTVRHHGESVITEQNIIVRPGPLAHIVLPYNRGEITDSVYNLVGVVGEAGNQESGDIFCIMNYNPTFDWSYKKKGQVEYLYMVPLMPLGTLFCDSADGTDINKKDSTGANNYFGDATKGNCLSQFKMK